MTATFEWQGVTVTVKRPTVRDGLTVQAVKNRLSLPDEALDHLEIVLRHVFARYLVLTSLPENVKADFLPLPSPTAPPDELRAALAAWSDLDEAFMDQWYSAVDRTTAPLNDPELVPEAVAPNP